MRTGEWPATGVCMPKLWAALGLLGNAFTWGVSWWPLRQLQGMGVHPLWSTAFIYIAALLLLLLPPSAWLWLAWWWC
jgi:hypothetical protein